MKYICILLIALLSSCNLFKKPTFTSEEERLWENIILDTLKTVEESRFYYFSDNHSDTIFIDQLFIEEMIYNNLNGRMDTLLLELAFQSNQISKLEESLQKFTDIAELNTNQLYLTTINLYSLTKLFIKLTEYLGYENILQIPDKDIFKDI